MIAILSEIKSLLGISGTDQDARITAMMEPVEWDIIEECNNYFTTSTRYSGPAEFEAGKIKAEGIDDIFQSGDWVLIDGTTRNNGYTKVIGVAPGEIEISGTTDETATCTINLVSVPVSLKIYYARMIGYLLARADDAGVKSESIGNYSYSLGEDTGYPVSIISGLSKWKLAKTARGSIRRQYRDLRGSSGTSHEPGIYRSALEGIGL